MSESAQITDQVLHGTAILVVEDLPDSRDLLEVFLTFHGAEVVAVGSSAEALQALETYRPDLILTDIGLPDEDGLQFFDKVRARATGEGTQAPPVIAVTAYEDPAIHCHIYDQGFRALVVKPFESSMLLETIRRALA